MLCCNVTCSFGISPVIFKVLVFISCLWIIFLINLTFCRLLFWRLLFAILELSWYWAISNHVSTLKCNTKLIKELLWVLVPKLYYQRRFKESHITCNNKSNNFRIKPQSLLSLNVLEFDLVFVAARLHVHF